MVKEKSNIMFTNKVIILLIKLLLICSTPFLTILLSNRFETNHILAGAIISFFIGAILFLKIFKIEKINIKKFIFVAFISLYMITILLTFCENNIILFEKFFKKLFDLKLSSITLQKILGFLSIPSTIYFVYLFVDKIILYIKKFKSSLTKVEKRYFVIMLIVAIILSIGITVCTTAFSKPIYNDKVEIYDVIYTSDSGTLTDENAYFNVSFIENDVRQPLFGIFALPFAVAAKLLSEVCFFLPDNFAYEIILTIIQFLLTTITTIMIGQMLKLEEKDKKYLYLLFSFSFTYMIFNLVLEQYVIGLFYLILAIYIYSKNMSKINYMYIGAVGTLLTSGIIFPLITKAKNTKLWFVHIFKCLSAFISVVIIGGQFPQLIIGIDKLTDLTTKFTGKSTWYDKICQFTNFVEGIFFSEQGHFQMLEKHPSYQLVDFHSISIIGVIIIGIMIISYILNRKNKMAKLSILWVLFSIFILLIIGWGMLENGLILYSLYFAWAYLVLYFLFIKKLFKNRKVFVTIMIISLLTMLTFNMNEFINILQFALKYY